MHWKQKEQLANSAKSNDINWFSSLLAKNVNMDIVIKQ